MALQLTALPPGWEEITRTSSDTGIGVALDLLNTTFPKRYPHLNVTKLRAKLEYDRDNVEGDAAVEVLVSSLRLFRHTTNAVVDVALFFFLRYLKKPRAYCISVGVEETVTPETLRAELEAMCRFLQQEQAAIKGVSTIDILSHKKDVPADLDETNSARIVGRAFQLARNQLFDRDTIEPGGAWPSELFRWEVAVL